MFRITYISKIDNKAATKTFSKEALALAAWADVLTDSCVLMASYASKGSGDWFIIVSTYVSTRADIFNGRDPQ